MERRTDERRRIRLPIVHWPRVDGRSTGAGTEQTTHDLSPGGTSFRCDSVLPIGTELSAELHLPGHAQPLSATAQVTSVASELDGDGFRVGLRFVEIPDDDRDAIVTCLDRLDLFAITRAALEGGASDIHLTVGRPPVIRVQGRLLPLDAHELVEGQIKAMVYPLLDRNQIQRLETTRELDFAFSPDAASRFRLNLHYQRGFLEAVLRSVPVETRDFEDLKLPARALERLCQERSGLVLISGTTGSGKTTTVSAMVDFINRTQERVVITIESPIEFLHASRKSLVKQRELGADTLSYAEALTRALRQDPDVIVVGELVDRDCVEAALRAAETGHLVITTVHASDSAQAIERLIHLFPPAHAESVAQQVASSLLGVLYQRLVPATDGDRVLASAMLVATLAVRNLIREQKLKQLGTCLQTGRTAGMHTLQQSLEQLERLGLVSAETVQEQLRND